MARCNCGVLPLITVDPTSALTMTGTGTVGDPLVLGNRPSAMGMVTFTTPGVTAWAKGSFPGVQWIRVRAVGGGGGSAGVTAGAGVGVARGGGGGASYAESWFDVDTLGVSETVQVGAAGAAGAAANGAGGDGGASAFSGSLFANGGAGSLATVAPGAGVLVSGGGSPLGGNSGQFVVLGGNGQDGVQFSATQRIGGAGGAGAVYGTAGKSVYELGTGQLGRQYGSGASGPAAFNGSFAGSAGGSGIVVIEMFR